MMKNASFIKRLSFAKAGILSALKKESSLKTQFVCAGLLLVVSLVLQPSAVWCAIFIGMCSLVISLELVNSAFEAYLDKFHPEQDATVGAVKDCLAGAVLIASLGSVFVFLFFLYEHFSS